MGSVRKNGKTNAETRAARGNVEAKDRSGKKQKPNIGQNAAPVEVNERAGEKQEPSVGGSVSPPESLLKAKGRSRKKRKVNIGGNAAPADAIAAISADEEVAGGWFPIWLAASAFGMTRQGFHDQVRPHVGKADVRGAGERGTKIRCRGAIEAWMNHKLGILAADGDEDAELLMGGGNSPALEEYRKYHAGREKIKLETDRKMSIPREQLEPALGTFAAKIRIAAELLQRKFGDEASAVVNEAIDAAVAIWEKMLKESAQ